MISDRVTRGQLNCFPGRLLDRLGMKRDKTLKVEPDIPTFKVISGSSTVDVVETEEKGDKSEEYAGARGSCPSILPRTSLHPHSHN